VFIDGTEGKLPTCEEVIFLNISSYGGGMDLWGARAKDVFTAPDLADRKIEVLTVEGTMHIGQVRMGLRRGHRVAQASEIHIKRKSEPKSPLPLQVDGEPLLDYSDFKEIHLVHLNQVTMLKYDPPPSRLKGLLQKMKNGEPISSSSSWTLFLTTPSLPPSLHRQKITQEWKRSRGQRVFMSSPPFAPSLSLFFFIFVCFIFSHSKKKKERVQQARAPFLSPFKLLGLLQFLSQC